MTQPDEPSRENAAGEKTPSRAVNNLIVGAFIAALLVAGVWIFNAIEASRKAQECLESRRRNCTIIDAPR